MDNLLHFQVPKLHNTDGEPLEMHRLVFDFDRSEEQFAPAQQYSGDASTSASTFSIRRQTRYRSQLQAKKRALADLILDDEPGQAVKFSPSDLEALFTPLPSLGASP